MIQQPEIDEVRDYVVAQLRLSPVHASTRFSLAEDLVNLYPSLDRETARFAVARALARLQEDGTVDVLRPETWDFSGDERVRLRSNTP